MMSVESAIGYMDGESVRYIYCRHDGWIYGGVGEALMNHWDSEDLARLLIDGGHVERLRDEDAVLEIPKDGPCVAENYDEFLYEIYPRAEYAYVFYPRDMGWTVKSVRSLSREMALSGFRVRV